MSMLLQEGQKRSIVRFDLGFLFFLGVIFLLWLVSEGDLDEVVVFVIVLVVVVRRLRIVTSESFLGFPGSAFKSV